MMSDLTAKQRRFVDEYLIDLNATQAAIRSGYAPSGARTEGARLLANADIADAIAAAQLKRSMRTKITQDQVLTELAKIGFADIRRAVRWQAQVVEMDVDDDTGEQRLSVTNQVQIIDSDDIDGDTAAAISEISQSDKGALKIKFHDKQAALVNIGKHLGMFVSLSADVTDRLDKLDDRAIDAAIDALTTAIGAAGEDEGDQGEPTAH